MIFYWHFLCIKFCLFPLSKVLHFYRKISLVLSLFQVWVDLVRINNEFSTNNLSTLVPAGPPKKQELWDTHQWIVDTGTKRRVPKCRMEQMSHSFQPPMNHHQTNGQDCQPSIATAYSIVPRHYILKLILVQCVHTHTHTVQFDITFYRHFGTWPYRISSLTVVQVLKTILLFIETWSLTYREFLKPGVWKSQVPAKQTLATKVLNWSFLGNSRFPSKLPAYTNDQVMILVKLNLAVIIVLLYFYLFQR